MVIAAKPIPAHCTVRLTLRFISTHSDDFVQYYRIFFLYKTITEFRSQQDSSAAVLSQLGAF